MAIQERELHYPPDSPLRAWRLFRVRAIGTDLLLSAPMYHNPDPPPWPNVSSTASCHANHPAPAPACRCGIYAAIAGALDSLPGYLHDTARIAPSRHVLAGPSGTRYREANLDRLDLGLSKEIHIVASDEVLTSAGAVAVTAPRVNDRRVDPETGERVRFSSAILPPWARKSAKVSQSS